MKTVATMVLWIVGICRAGDAIEQGAWKDVLCGIQRPLAMVKLPALWYGVLEAADTGSSLRKAKGEKSEALSTRADRPTYMEYDYRRDTIFVVSEAGVSGYHRRKKNWIDIPNSTGDAVPSATLSYMNRRLYYIVGSELRGFDPREKRTDAFADLSTIEPFASYRLSEILVSADGKRLYWTGVSKEGEPKAVLGLFSFDEKKNVRQVDLGFADVRAIGFYQGFVLVLGHEPGQVAARSTADLSEGKVRFPKEWNFQVQDMKVDAPDIEVLEDKSEGACIKKGRIAIDPPLVR